MTTELLIAGICELIPLFSALTAFIFGLRSFFKKGIPLCLQSITMAMGCHALSNLYHLCYLLTNGTPADRFTPAYLGQIGFFLFFITASYGQLDKIIDDGSAVFRPSRRIALLAPLAAAVLLIPNMLAVGPTPASKAAYIVIWIAAFISLYFNTKHAIIPDLDFSFVKGLKPYNRWAVCVGFSELLCLTARNYAGAALSIAAAVLFSVFAVLMMVSAKKGVTQWTI